MLKFLSVLVVFLFATECQGQYYGNRGYNPGYNFSGLRITVNPYRSYGSTYQGAWGPHSSYGRSSYSRNYGSYGRPNSYGHSRKYYGNNYPKYYKNWR